MKIREIQIRNFRSVADQTIRFGHYSLLIGANNSGKSNVMDAIRALYEKDLKFEFDRDFPKFATNDQESWIEVEYELTADEASNLKAEYLIGKDGCRVRRWLHPADKSKAGLFGYENGTLSQNLFYGWKNVAQGKLGNLIYIPAVSRLEEHTKLTGPSALRDLINDILKPIIKSSAAFTTLTSEFQKFGTAIKDEKTVDQRSLSGLESKVNAEIQEWGVAFNLNVSSPQDDDIVKSLIKHTLTDSALNQQMEAGAFGHGLQRHLIFTLIRIAASYTAPKPPPKKKEFSPELEVVLFEEPEAFLHPPQQDVLDTSLRQLASQSGRQVITATHSPQFVSYNADDIADLVRVSRINGKTEVAQVSQAKLREIFEENQQIKAIVDGTAGAAAAPVNDADLELEAVRHFLWLNPVRSNLFFAHGVLIVEGLSEQVVISYLIKRGEVSTNSKGVFVLEPIGKFNIHRFMNLLGELRIKHAVLHDMDASKTGKQKAIQDGLNNLIQQSKNPSTRAIDTLPDNLETALGVTITDNDRWKKAAQVLMAVQQGKIALEKLLSFKKKIEALVSSLVA